MSEGNDVLLAPPQALSQQLQDCQAETRELAGEAIGAVRTVRSLHAERQELRRYEEALQKMFRIKKRKGIYSAVHLLLRRVREREKEIHQHHVLLLYYVSDKSKTEVSYHLI